MSVEQLIQRVERIQAKERLLYDMRMFKKPFYYIEDIAKNRKLLKKYNLEARESNAKQREFSRSKAKICAIIAGNRSGKTEVGAEKFLKSALKKKGRYWALCPSYQLQRAGTQEKILELLKPEHIKHISKIDSRTVSSILLVNDSIIEFKTYEQGWEKLQSAKIAGAWLDEEPPERIFKEVYTRTIDLGGQLILTFTPLKGMTWSYNQIFSKADKKNIDVYTWGMADNPFIPPDEIKKLIKMLSKKEAQMRLHGRYTSSSGMVYTNWERQTHIKPIKYNHKLPCYVSVDWGYTTCSIGFFQYNQAVDEVYLIDYVEGKGFGYRQIMNTVTRKPYRIDPGNYFCDPAGKARSQTTGHDLLSLIQRDYGITFNYAKSNIMDGVNVVDSYIMNEEGKLRYYMNEGLDDAYRAKENYLWAEKDGVQLNIPDKDGVNDHFNDMERYFFINLLRGQRSLWRQS